MHLWRGVSVQASIWTWLLFQFPSTRWYVVYTFTLQTERKTQHTKMYKATQGQILTKLEVTYEAILFFILNNCWVLQICLTSDVVITNNVTIVSKVVRMILVEAFVRNKKWILYNVTPNGWRAPGFSNFYSNVPKAMTKFVQCVFATCRHHTLCMF